jgi:hypothetical protein
MRDLVRARAAAVETLCVHRQQVSAFMLRHGRIFPRKTAWGARHLRWLQEQKFNHPAHQIALQEMVEAVRISKERVERLEAAIKEFVPEWSLAPVVQALQTLRGIDLIVAVTCATELGDLSRFDNPRQLMGYLGLTPSERSTGDTVRRGGITKAGVDFGFKVRLKDTRCVFSVSFETGWQSESQMKPKIGRVQAKTASRSSAGFQRSTSSSVICSLPERTASTASSFSMQKTFAVIPSVARVRVRKL